MTTVEPIELLQKSLELAQEQLKLVDGDIKRITGKDPTEDRYLNRTVETNGKRSNMKSSFKSQVLRPLSMMANSAEKQKLPEDDLQVSVASSVVRVGESRTRLDASKALMKSDKERGRRMLGILQGTLNQFRAESAAAVTKPQMAKRREIDAKLEARAEEEREVLRRERAELFRARREQQLEIALLQEKVRIAKGFEVWKGEMEKMIGFCRTDVTPHIFFQPKTHNEESKHRMETTAEAIRDMISHRKRKLDRNFEESSAARRRYVSHHNKDKHDDTKDVAKDEIHSSWSLSRHDGAPNDSFVSTTQSTSLFESNGSKLSRRRPHTSEVGHSDMGDMSDASETFAIEGDEEPLLMEEEHVAGSGMTTGSAHSPAAEEPRVVSPGPEPQSPENQKNVRDVTVHQSSPDRDDTRTVRLD